eukprot:9473636-Alexandrium_andersonii.AAC.1
MCIRDSSAEGGRGVHQPRDLRICRVPRTGYCPGMDRRGFRPSAQEGCRRELPVQVSYRFSALAPLRLETVGPQYSSRAPALLYWLKVRCNQEKA